MTISRFSPLPDAVSFEVGASIGIPLMTAWHAVTACGSLLGKVVLVPGAAGAVGQYVTRLARGIDELLQADALVHPATRVYPLQEIAAAHAEVERGADAKVLLRL